MRAYVLNAGWLQFGISAFTMHDAYLPPPPPAPPLKSMPGLVEGPAFMGWPPGCTLHKKASTVLVDGNPGIQEGHDVGYLIPHLAIPLNALCLVHTGLSKHKVMIPVSSVLLQGKPVGTYFGLILLGLICSDPISLPTGVLIRTKGTVETSATLGDILKGLAYIAIDIVFDLVWNRFKGKLPKFGTDVNAKYLNELLNPLKGTALGDLLRWTIAQELKELAVTEIGNKVVSKLIKSWVVSPIATGGARGNPGIGRGKSGWKPFDKNLW